MMSKSPIAFERVPKQALFAALLGLLVLVVASPALAQLEESYQEQEVQSVEEREEAPQESVREQLEAEPRAEVRWFEEAISLDQIERMDTAMNRLRDLVDDAQTYSEQRADYMFRLAELYYKRARFYEQRAYERRDRAFEARETNPAQAQQYERAAEDDLEQSDFAALEAINLYVEIYENFHDNYPDMDGVLYYLGSTLSQLSRLEDALDFFEELVNDYPSSSYLPRALLAFGEYYFLIEGDMSEAQMFYQAVTEFPESDVYPYALYQEAWCFYNLTEYPEAVQRLLDAIEASSGDSSGRIRMKRRALHDLAMFYVTVGTAENAFGFFESIPDIEEEQIISMVELVARLYGEEGNYAESNALYRELMLRNRDSFKVVHYQREIVRNTLPSGNEEDIVIEVRRWTELFNTAKDFDDATPQAVNEAADRIEYEVRRLATTYHRDAQVTNNLRLYAMAYNLYGDYVNDLAEDWAEPETRYTMTFYYAELLYRNENYAEAATMWEQCLDIDPTGEYNEEAIYKAVLAYTRLVDMEGEMEVEHTQIQSSSEGDIEAQVGIPVPRELPEVMQNLIRAADRYLDLNPPSEYAVEVEFAAARVLYEYAHLSEAAYRFGQIAVNYIEIDPERAQVSAELLLDSLYTLNDVEGMERWVTEFRATDLNRGQFAVRLNSLGTQISFSNCRQVQLNQQYEECGLCYFDFFREYHDSDLVDRALFNSALCFDNADMLAQSIRVRELLIQYRPESSLVPDIRFGLGQAYHRLALYRDASTWYEQYAREHPDEDHADDALGSAATFRQGLGEFDEAIADYEAFIDLFDDREEEAATAFFQIGVIYEDREQTDRAVRQFTRYLDRWADRGVPGLTIEAATRLGRLTWQDDPEAAEGWFIQALDSYNAMTDEEKAALEGTAFDAAAEARFMLGEYVFQQFTEVQISGNETQVQESMRMKLEIGTQASSVYEQVRAFQRPGWSIAAFTRLGQLYHEFYESVINAPVPDDMPWEVEEAYRAMLVEQSEQVRTQAIVNYSTALQIARTAGWFNEYSALAEQNLAQLDPSFRAGNEVRATPGYQPTSFYQHAFATTLEDEEEEEVAPEADDAPPADAAPDGAGQNQGEREQTSEVAP